MTVTPVPRLNPESYGWDWAQFTGTARALALNHRDLAAIDAVLALVPGRTAVIQAGGNLGIFPKRLAQTFTTVYTFEPATALFADLYRNAPEANIVKFQAALGEVRGGVHLVCARRDGKRRPPHEGVTHIDGPGVVPTLRIDDLALPVCDLIYLDVEGWELAAVRGAGQTLARCRPVLVIEVNQNVATMGLTVAEIHAAIKQQGYRHVTRVLSDDVFVPVERVA